MLQQPEDRLGDEPQEAVVDGQFQAWGQLFQLGLDLRAGVQQGTGFDLAASRYADNRAGVADDVVALAILAGLDNVVVRLGRNPGGHEVVLQPGNPAAGHIFFQTTFVDVLHRDLFVRLRSCPQGSTQVGSGAGGSTGGRIAAGITLELGKHVAVPGLAALVVDQVADIQVVLTALEAETLDVVDTVVTELQVYHQLFLAVGQLVALLLGGIQGTAAGAGIRAIGAGQTTLCQVNTLTTVVEQLEWNVRVVLTAWVLRQVQLDDVTTDRIDSQFQNVGLDSDQVLAECDRCQFGRARFGVGARYIGAGTVVTGRHAIGQARSNSAGSSILSRQGSLAVVIVPLQDHDVGHDCQRGDQDRAFNIHDYSAIEEVREEGAGGTGSKPPSFHG